jgi:hypothetical protein
MFSGYISGMQNGFNPLENFQNSLVQDAVRIAD